MNPYCIRTATRRDIPFLVETIVEAEKGGSDKFSYSTIFGLSVAEAEKHIGDMLGEEIDGCELSLSSFMVAESSGLAVAAVGAWIEGSEGMPSTVLKGNLLSHILPKECLNRAISLSAIVRDLHIECVRGAIQVGLAYVAAGFRGRNLIGLLIERQIERLLDIDPGLTEIYVQVLGNNIPAIRTYEKSGFEIVARKESPHTETIRYLPSNIRLLMKKTLPRKNINI